MPREIALFSVLVPTLLPVFLACMVLYELIDGLFARVGLYRRVWHPALFRAALFVCIFSGTGLLLWD
ncbi:DUF1656 domain-containing protein [Cupriavidus necator]|uniref:DUF1656 domain-containing protein n=1 Tax=Cupriavidus necator TaxID=106590 RepID=UPI00148F7443|nr:DUF1656 domain-containing protein [Cupriavidus necator]NOV23960.1 DUF1656 domain-containing protein [Cupriavidus necator]